MNTKALTNAVVYAIQNHNGDSLAPFLSEETSPRVRALARFATSWARNERVRVSGKSEYCCDLHARKAADGTLKANPCVQHVHHDLFDMYTQDEQDTAPTTFNVQLATTLMAYLHCDASKADVVALIPLLSGDAAEVDRWVDWAVEA